MMALDTKNFIKSLILKDYTHVCVVPCSFAKYPINEAINNPKIEYVPCASEAVACSVAAGLKISGKKPIVIIQSSGLTNMGSCITSLLKPYNITFPILTSWRTYKEGDSEIQHQHLAKKLPDLINAYGYDYVVLDQDDIDSAISQIEFCNNTQTICIIKKDTFTKILLDEEYRLSLNYAPRSQFLIVLNEMFGHSDMIFIGTTGNTAREMYNIMKDTKNFYMVGNMGGALSIGLGVAKAGKKAIVCGGDAEFVMHMGGLSTTGRYAKEIDLTYILFDNEQNKSTGGQNTYQKHIDYTLIAKACGFNVHQEVVSSVKNFSQAMLELSQKYGLNFLHVKCGVDDEMPRPPYEAVRVNKIYE
ncbi:MULTISPECIES: thiamine pyrophosphate-dependent enzyme [Campylobacter]|uniref:thiamine pyrophosphate-dependent enzyme n=1 Tax=Campylobacter TaxID=194 RepID=UPI00054D1A2E|nr:MULTISPECIES: thiamine pyrophosphate-dependent enzyme [Campylobacter]